jgi:glyoxylase-like metal-dependent hydrolase (beta-lactamase superfamily II)
MHGAAGASLGLLPGFYSSFVAHAQSSANNQTLDLGGGLHVLTVGQTNVVARTGAEGVMLVDGGAAAQSAALSALISALPATGKVHTLFNTHWHPEQTGLNEELGRAGAQIIAQENTRLWLTTDVTWPWNGATVQPLPVVARPNKTFFGRDEIVVDGKRVQYGHIPHAPHTDGDMYVFFADANVLAVGGAMTAEGWQVIDWWTGGWIGGVVGGLELLLSLTDAQTRIVTARGPILTRADLEEQFQMYSTVYERLSRLLNSGRSPREATESSVTVEFDAKMGNSDEFVTRAFESMWAYLSPDA